MLVRRLLRHVYALTSRFLYRTTISQQGPHVRCLHKCCELKTAISDLKGMFSRYVLHLELMPSTHSSGSDEFARIGTRSLQNLLCPVSEWASHGAFGIVLLEKPRAAKFSTRVTLPAKQLLPKPIREVHPRVVCQFKQEYIFLIVLIVYNAVALNNSIYRKLVSPISSLWVIWRYGRPRQRRWTTRSNVGSPRTVPR